MMRTIWPERTKPSRIAALKAAAIAAFPIPIPASRAYDMTFGRRLAISRGATMDSVRARKDPKIQISDARGIFNATKALSSNWIARRDQHRGGTQTQRAML